MNILNCLGIRTENKIQNILIACREINTLCSNLTIPLSCHLMYLEEIKNSRQVDRPLNFECQQKDIHIIHELTLEFVLDS